MPAFLDTRRENEYSIYTRLELSSGKYKPERDSIAAREQMELFICKYVEWNCDSFVCTLPDIGWIILYLDCEFLRGFLFVENFDAIGE